MKRLATRSLAVIASLALASVLGELLFDFVFDIAGKPMVFTSFYGFVVFSTLVGFLPSWPSPSRLSKTPIGSGGRFFLVIESVCAVLLAATASSQYLIYVRRSAPFEVSAAIYVYSFILLTFFSVNFSRLRSEATTYHARKTSDAKGR